MVLHPAFLFPLIGLCWLFPLNPTDAPFCRQPASSSDIHIDDDGKRVEVLVNGKLFTRYDYSGFKKPIFYPLLGPSQIPFTRNFPMKKVDGEADDHPHHKSAWIGHEIDGVDFWSESEGTVRATSIRCEPDQNGFSAAHNWVEDSTGRVVVRDALRVRFGADQDSRYVDYRITFYADQRAVTFADTKEGFFALRVHPQIQNAPDPARGVETVSGQIVDAAGRKNGDVWGQKAKWVTFFGRIEGKSCGITVFDHPDNIRHPTTWHARDYGLLAANPFGLHAFQNLPPGSGEFVLQPNHHVSFRYRVLLHLESDQLQIADHFNSWIKQD
jgi:hypothetical protein